MEDLSQDATQCRRLAALGFPEAQYNLGWIALTGDLVKQDTTAALKWLHLAADADFAAAELVLGKELATGARLPRDQVGALGWLLVAEPRLTSGQLIDKYHQDAVNGITALQFQVTPSQAGQARAWAEAWNKEHPITPPDDPRDRVADGLDLEQSGDFAGAIAQFDAAIQLQPDRAETYRLRGEAWRRKNDLVAAVKDFDKAIAIALENAAALAAALNDRGFARSIMGNSEGALADLSMAIRVDPGASIAWVNRGMVLDGLGELDRAIADFDAAIKINPNDAGTAQLRASVYFRKGDFALAAKDFKRVVEIDHDAAGTYGMLVSYISEGRLGKDGSGELAANIDRLASRDWPFPVAEYFLGRRSKDTLLAAAASANERCEAQFYIGERQFIDGALEEAKASLSSAVATCPHNFEEYRYALAELNRWAR